MATEIEAAKLMVYNATTIADDSGAYPDWIELYSALDVPLDLSGYSMSDDLDDPLKHMLGALTISPGGFLLLWAVVVFAFFSVSSSKLASYILPIFPALAALIGFLIARVPSPIFFVSLAFVAAADEVGLVRRAG